MCPEDSYQCKDTNYCLAWDYICDGIDHCPLGDDETLCDKCIKNEYKCLDGSQMSCELSCTILGFIPCTKYRNRVTCNKYYPNALGAYFKTSSFNGLNDSNQTNNKIFYICGIISIFVFILLIFLILAAIYKHYKSKSLLKFKQTTLTNTRLTDNRHQNLNEILYKQQQKERERNHEDDEHKYQEINDECLLDDEKDDLEAMNFVRSTCNDYYKVQIVPPPYNSAHLFESIQFKTPVKIPCSKSTCV